MRNNISKNDILQKIKKINGLPISYLDEVFENIFDVIKKGLIKDGVFKISGFGTFKVFLKRERIGMNPKTKIKYPIIQKKCCIIFIHQK
jgi:Bacterial nucleoid DNA-binding protein